MLHIRRILIMSIRPGIMMRGGRGMHSTKEVVDLGGGEVVGGEVGGGEGRGILMLIVVIDRGGGAKKN